MKEDNYHSKNIYVRKSTSLSGFNDNVVVHLFLCM